LPRQRLTLSHPGSESASLDVEVRPSSLDHLVHVNNAVYANFLEDGAFELFARLGFGLERMLATRGALRIRSIDLEYLADASFGTKLRVRSWLAPASDWSAQPRDARLEQVIEGEDGSTLLRARSDWVWRTAPSVLGGPPER
jgi:acyl-CoA thioesterase FadM